MDRLPIKELRLNVDFSFKKYRATQRTTRNNKGPQWAIHAENLENL
jgi:hypothetical protein